MTEETASNVHGQDRWRAAMMDSYGTPALTITGGDGVHLIDADGKRYLDLLSGIAVNALGHGHPAIVAAVTEQVAKFAHVSNFYAHTPGLALAERLLELVGTDGRVLFCNSGAEANEAALKISRLSGRTNIVAVEGAFHGRTMGSLALTGQPAKQRPFEPLVPGVSHVPFGDVDALRAAINDDTAALFVEPILGEGGVLPVPDGYLRAARDITTAAGALLIVDEVQTGIGRTGAWFGFQHSGVVPDVVTLAKGLGGGLPIGAVLALGKTSGWLTPGSHGTTFGGNPVSCAAGLAVLDTIASDGLIDNAALVGKELTRAIEELDHRLVAGVRGQGLLLGIGLRRDVSAAAARAATESGYLLNAVTADTMRLAPPLILTREHVSRFVADLPSILDAASKEQH